MKKGHKLNDNMKKKKTRLSKRTLRDIRKM